MVCCLADSVINIEIILAHTNNVKKSNILAAQTSFLKWYERFVYASIKSGAENVLSSNVNSRMTSVCTIILKSVNHICTEKYISQALL